MAAADKKITYTSAEVAELIRPLSQSVEALQKENAELKRKRVFSMFGGEQRLVEIRFINPLLDAVVDRFGTSGSCKSLKFYLLRLLRRQRKDRD